MERSQKITLILGFAIPVLAIIGVALAIYIPRATATPPHYDFVYTSNNYRYRGNTEVWFEVHNGVLIAQERVIDGSYPEKIKNPASPPESVLPALYLYDVETATSKEVTLTEAQSLHLSQAVLAPDGYRIERGGGGGGMFPFYFESSNYEDVYLSKGSYAVKIDIASTLVHDYFAFEFLGWVIPEDVTN